MTNSNIELCIFCSPEDVYQDGELSSKEITEIYGEELPICNTCYEDDGYEIR